LLIWKTGLIGIGRATRQAQREGESGDGGGTTKNLLVGRDRNCRVMNPGNPDLHEQGKDCEGGASLTHAGGATDRGAAKVHDRSATRPSHRPNGTSPPFFPQIGLHANRSSHLQTITWS